MNRRTERPVRSPFVLVGLWLAGLAALFTMGGPPTGRADDLRSGTSVTAASPGTAGSAIPEAAAEDFTGGTSAAISAEELRAIVVRLASPDLQGRDTPGPGGVATARLLAERFAELGLRPPEAETGSGDGAGADRGAGVGTDGGAGVGTDGGREGGVGGSRPPRTREVAMAAIAAPEAYLLTYDDDRVPVEDEEPGEKDSGEREPGEKEPGEREPGEREPGEKEPGEREPGEEIEIFHNVVGLVPGAGSDRVIVIGAHYDALGIDDDRPLPGADDNGSGVALLLELAEALTTPPAPHHTVMFVAFGSEEDGLHGSKAFVRHPVVPLDRIVAMINLDMLGRPRSGRITVVGWDVYPELARPILKAARARGMTAIGGSRHMWKRSDHYPFAEAGIPAVWLFCQLHEDYHEHGDVPELLDYPFLETLGKSLLDLLARPLEPEGDRPDPDARLQREAISFGFSAR